MGRPPGDPVTEITVSQLWGAVQCIQFITFETLTQFTSHCSCRGSQFGEMQVSPVCFILSIAAFGQCDDERDKAGDRKGGEGWRQGIVNFRLEAAPIAPVEARILG